MPRLKNNLIPLCTSRSQTPGGKPIRAWISALQGINNHFSCPERPARLRMTTYYHLPGIKLGRDLSSLWKTGFFSVLTFRISSAMFPAWGSEKHFEFSLFLHDRMKRNGGRKRYHRVNPCANLKITHFASRCQGRCTILPQKPFQALQNSLASPKIPTSSDEALVTF